MTLLCSDPLTSVCPCDCKHTAGQLTVLTPAGLCLHCLDLHHSPLYETEVSPPPSSPPIFILSSCHQTLIRLLHKEVIFFSVIFHKKIIVLTSDELVVWHGFTVSWFLFLFCFFSCHRVFHFKSSSLPVDLFLLRPIFSIFNLFYLHFSLLWFECSLLRTGSKFELVLNVESRVFMEELYLDFRFNMLACVNTRSLSSHNSWLGVVELCPLGGWWWLGLGSVTLDHENWLFGMWIRAGYEKDFLVHSSASRKLRNLYLNGHEGCLKEFFFLSSLLFSFVKIERLTSVIICLFCHHNVFSN